MHSAPFSTPTSVPASIPASDAVPEDHERTIPYWLVNVPRGAWPADQSCPPYLQDLSAKDVAHLAVRDEDYKLLSWEEVRGIVATDRLEAFTRLPSELRRYRWYTWKLARDHGSVLAYMLSERLRWADLTPRSAAALEDGDDFTILRNDWPYGIDHRIVHLVVWTKHVFPADATTGAPTVDAKRRIDAFVQRTFNRAVDSRDKLLWFKNPMALRSVPAAEHFHVLLFQPDAEFVRMVTRGDVPTCEMVGKGGQDGYL